MSNNEHCILFGRLKNEFILTTLQRRQKKHKLEKKRKELRSFKTKKKKQKMSEKDGEWNNVSYLFILDFQKHYNEFLP